MKISIGIENQQGKVVPLGSECIVQYKYKGRICTHMAKIESINPITNKVTISSESVRVRRTIRLDDILTVYN